MNPQLLNFLKKTIRYSFPRNLEHEDRAYRVKANARLRKATTIRDIVFWMQDEGWIYEDALSIFLEEEVARAFNAARLRKNWDT